MERKRQADAWIDTFWKIESYDEHQIEQPDGSYWFQNLYREENWVDIHFVHEGRMLFIDRDGLHEIPAGYAFMYAHQDDSEFGLPADFGEPVVMAWMGFSGRGLREHWSAIRRQFGSVFYVGSEGAIRQVWRDLGQHLNPSTSDEMALASTAVHAFVMQIYAFLDQQKPQQTGVERAIDDLLRRPTHPWSLKEVAARHGCTREYLSRVFRQRVGTSPGTYLRQAKLKKALDLLRCSTLPLARIAQECGFGSDQTLAHWVRIETGTTPGAVRRQATAKSRTRRASG